MLQKGNSARNRNEEPKKPRNEGRNNQKKKQAPVPEKVNKTALWTKWATKMSFKENNPVKPYITVVMGIWMVVIPEGYSATGIRMGSDTNLFEKEMPSNLRTIC